MNNNTCVDIQKDGVISMIYNGKYINVAANPDFFRSNLENSGVVIPFMSDILKENLDFPEARLILDKMREYAPYNRFVLMTRKHLPGFVETYATKQLDEAIEKSVRNIVNRKQALGRTKRS